VNHKGKKIRFTFLLSLPLLAFFLGYLFNHSSELEPTGFIQYDNVSYIAYAKQYLDADFLHLQYSNPFNDSNFAPSYIQPQTFFIAFLLKIGIPPGWILIPFSFIFSLICFWLIISLYDFLFPQSKWRTLNIWLFAWGGGILVLAGLFAQFYLKEKTGFVNGLFVLDPESGWWGLNLGRSLFFTCEAYYHALFLGCIYSLLKRKWLQGFILMLLLSLSHPFSGIELIGIVCAWCFVEFLHNKKEIPVLFFAGALAALCFHIYYYLFYLEQFPDHKSVSEQYTLTWRLGIYRMIPAYCIVGALTIASIYKFSFKKFFEIRGNRIFACWFLVAFLLANHEIFMKARQPIHFTRGYIWTSLFLLGLPALNLLNSWLKPKFGKAGIAVFAALFFLDNFSWISNQALSKKTQTDATYINKEQKEVLKILNSESSNKSLIISSDNTIAYLSSVYTKAYPWYSHQYTTPFSERKKLAQEAFLNTGIVDSAWINREINFVLKKTDTVALNAIGRIPMEKLIQTENYFILKCRLSGN